MNSITLPSDPELEIYLSDAGFVVVKHYDDESGSDASIIMSKRRAAELSYALAKVAGGGADEVV